METTEQKVKIKEMLVDNAELKQMVLDLIRARAVAKTLRKKVDEAGRVILAEMNIEIKEPNQVKNASDEDSQRYYNKMDWTCRAMGIKPRKMPFDHCPALCAEAEATDIENAILAIASEALDINRRLIKGDKRKELLDIIIRFHVSN